MNLIDEFNSAYTEPAFPAFVAERFDVLECIGETTHGETFLLREKTTALLYVLKAHHEGNNEVKLMHDISHPGLPTYESVTEHMNAHYTLRKYIEGHPLDKFIAKTRGASDTGVVVDVMLSLCDILEHLHSRAIVHRDIKPSNIIYEPKSKTVSLIDFGISRKFTEESDTDTTHFGTRQFASPEQYGFAQTDSRSDIFSLGVVLRYWLTGATARGAAIPDRTLAAIVKKCTAFEPDSRYRSAAAVKAALHKYKTRTHRRLAAFVCAALFVFIAAAGIFLFAQRDTQQLYVPAYAPNTPYIYTPYTPTVDVQLVAVPDRWRVYGGNVVTIGGNGVFTARLYIPDGTTAIRTLSVQSAAAPDETGQHSLDNAQLAHPRFYYARISFNSLIVNDSIALDVHNVNDGLLSAGVDETEGFVVASLWNAWWEPRQLIQGMYRIYDWSENRPDAVQFAIPGVDTIYTIELTFTISGL